MGYATILGLDLGKFKSVCCVMDLVLRHPRAPGGFVTQESILLKDFLANDFGVYYR